MKKLVLMLIVYGQIMALEIPKSSLEIVKTDLIAQLDQAKKDKNDSLVAKYETELTKIDQKIEHFELEWLKYRKRQLKMRSKTTAINKELAEIDRLIKMRS